MPKMDPAAPDPATGTSVPLAYDRTQAYDAKLAALGQQANSSCFTEMADATFFAQRPHLSKQQVLFALVRRQIIGTMLSRLLLADGWRCQFALFDGRGRPLVPLGLEVGEIMDRLMEDPESSSDQLAIHFRQPGARSRRHRGAALRIYGPGLDGPVARSGMLWGLGAHSGAGAAIPGLDAAGWIRGTCGPPVA
jgi:hypothetical protein